MSKDNNDDFLKYSVLLNENEKNKTDTSERGAKIIFCFILFIILAPILPFIIGVLCLIF